MLKRLLLTGLTALALAAAGATAAVAGPPAPTPLPRALPGTNLVKTGDKLFTANYFYAGLRQTVTEYSVCASVGIAAPGQTGTVDSHSLFEIAIDHGSSPLDYVEFGWNVEHAVWGDYNPHLFAGVWINGVFQGYNSLAVDGNAGASVPNLGDTLTPIANKKFCVTYVSGAWWLLLGTDWIAYFPDSVWTNAGESAWTQFTRVQLFGEVASPNTSPCEDMGNGRLPGQTSPSPLTIGSTTYGAGSGSVNLTAFRTNSSYYDAQLISPSVRSGYWGGPGAC